MKRIAVARWSAAAGLMLSVAAPAEQPAPHHGSEPTPHAPSTPSSPAEAATPHATAPRHAFAAILAQSDEITGPGGWVAGDAHAAWEELATAESGERQAARWRHAIGLIASAHNAEALGVLQVMLGDDPKLALIPSFRLAQAVVLIGLRRPDEAAPVLAMPELADNPEACAWRVRMERALHHPGAAVAAANCALPAINGRSGQDRAPFLLDAAAAAIDAGRPAQALTWLGGLPDDDTDGNLLRARAHQVAGKDDLARLRYQQVLVDGSPKQQREARIGLLEIDVAAKTVAAKDALHQADAIRFGWRGDDVEFRALKLALAQATIAKDVVAILRSGSTLLRYTDLGPQSGPVLLQLQQALVTLMASDSNAPLPQVAGLFWEYRELAPAGIAGDLMVRHLADRLQEAGLYDRAAELLGYQLSERAADVAKGPLSVSVATLRILSGTPQRALDALRESEGPGYPDSIAWARKRVEAIALAQLGKAEAALAALQDIPDNGSVRAEILWQQRSWTDYAALSRTMLPGGPTLDAASQTIVLRHAIALAMMAREDEIKALRTRYAAKFAGLPTSGAFDILTSPVGSTDPAKIGAAMAAIPATAPAEAILNLFYASPTKSPQG